MPDDALGSRRQRPPQAEFQSRLRTLGPGQQPGIVQCRWLLPFLSYLCFQPTLWPFEIKAPRLASAPTPCSDSPVCPEGRALGKTGANTRWGHPTEQIGKLKSREAAHGYGTIPNGGASQQGWPTATLPPPGGLCTGCSGLQGREEEEPWKHGEARWDLEGSLVKLSPLRPKRS